MCFYICNCFTVTATKCFHSKPLWFLRREKTVTRILFAQLYHWDTATTCLPEKEKSHQKNNIVNDLNEPVD